MSYCVVSWGFITYFLLDTAILKKEVLQIKCTLFYNKSVKYKYDEGGVVNGKKDKTF